MRKIIIAHPRSGSTYLLSGFSDSLGEVFDLQRVHPDSFELSEDLLHPDQTFPELWKTEWAQRYWDHLQKNILSKESFTIKIFFEHIVHNPQIIEYFKSHDFYTYSICRKNEIDRIKSFLTALSAGFHPKRESTPHPQVISYPQFLGAYYKCVLMPKLSHSLFKVDTILTYEELKAGVSVPHTDRPLRFNNNSSMDLFEKMILNHQEVLHWLDLLQKQDSN